VRLEAVAGVVGDGETNESARLLYDRIRLGIMSALSVNRSMSFSELKELLGTTDGNLSKHARRLEDAGLINCRKAFSRRVPRTQFRLTAKGRREFERHLQHMEALIQATRSE
jgi:DNA-binding MarR family transcriptional regulator